MPQDWEHFIGRQIGPDGRYDVRRMVGQGGMGVVFEAHEARKDRAVAIKVLTADHIDDTETLERFKREGSKFARIKHPNVVRVFGLGRTEGYLFIASEFVRGRNLYDIMQDEGAFGVDRSLRIASEIATGLKIAHDEGVIHRDLKPENVMITERDEVKILDFGIAKDLNASMALTVKGTYLGTPAYSSPEQVLGSAIDARADIFSLGVCLYEMVTGEVPFKGNRTTEVLVNTVKVDPIDPSRINRDLAGPVARLIARMISKKPRQRPRDCAEVIDVIGGLREKLARGELDPGQGVVGFLKKVFGA